MLRKAVESYLAVRRSAGFDLKTEGDLLYSFARFSEVKPKAFVDSPTAIEWAGSAPSLPQRARRLGVVIRFARYIHAEDQRHEIPPTGIFGSETRRRPVPYLFSPTDIQRLIEAASHSGRPGSLRPHTYSTLFALLACTGLRVSEAIRLRLGDITPDGLMIRCSKFRKSRLVPLHETARVGLDCYLSRRRPFAPSDDHVFISLRRRPLLVADAETAFRTAVEKIGLQRPGLRRPTLHSLRHTFAVRALETCPDGRDRITNHMLALSTYLGHSKVADTYWYLEATPELMKTIAVTCETFVTGGRP